jgi:aspartyl-tRNA(Asn)/glutamyl-tRNA(Gln) amidotransferase subunit B
LAHAVEYEIERQQAVLEKGGTILQETLGWDESAGVTVTRRSKEEAQDYRYFPEPDLPPLEVDRAWLNQIAASLPELPHQRLERLPGQYGISLAEADRITAEKETADYFESAVGAIRVARPKMLAAWLVGDLFGLLNARGKPLIRLEGQPEIAPGDLAGLVDLVASGTVTGPTAKSLLETMLDTGKSASALVEERGLGQIDDADALDGLIARVLGEHPEQVELYRSGKRTVLEWLLGQVIKASRGRANPSRVRSLLEEQLSSAGPKKA